MYFVVVVVVVTCPSIYFIISGAVALLCTFAYRIQIMLLDLIFFEDLASHRNSNTGCHLSACHSFCREQIIQRNHSKDE